MLGIIKRNSVHITQSCFVILYKSLVRSHLQYANSVWYPKRQEAQLKQGLADRMAKTAVSAAI